MNEEQALEIIKNALAVVLEREQEIRMDDHLIEDEILDSLDSAVFMLEIEKLSNKKLPKDQEAEYELAQVGKLVEYLIQH